MYVDMYEPLYEFHYLSYVNVDPSYDTIFRRCLEDADSQLCFNNGFTALQ